MRTSIQVKDYHARYGFKGYVEPHATRDALVTVEFIYNTKDGGKRWGRFSIPKLLPQDVKNRIITQEVDAIIKNHV